MAEKPPMSGAPMSQALRERWRELRQKLLRLHQTLLEMERENFERRFGRVTSGELLQLVINHTQFAWLRRISDLAAQVDEMLDSAEPATLSERQSLLAQARALLTPSATEDEFSEKYQAALQREPAAVMAHAEAIKLLAAGVEA